MRVTVEIEVTLEFSITPELGNMPFEAGRTPARSRLSGDRHGGRQFGAPAWRVAAVGHRAAECGAAAAAGAHGAAAL
jgi:hypothetical protein